MRLSLYAFHILAVGAALVFTGCADEPENDVKATPVGSVLTGETKDPEAYFEKVEQGNKARQEQQQYVSPFDREEPGKSGLTERY
ncbi:MAG: hypothetical protein ACQKBV_13295 [Puniceicoccales bacterium]